MIFLHQGLQNRIQLAFENAVELVEGEVDAVVGDAALGEVVGADALGAVAAADELAPGFGFALALFLFPGGFQFGFQQG